MKIIPKTFAEKYVEFVNLSFIEYNKLYKSHNGYRLYWQRHLSIPFSATWSIGGNLTDEAGETCDFEREQEPKLELLEEFLNVYYPSITDSQREIIDSYIETNVDVSEDSGGVWNIGIKEMTFDKLACAIAQAFHHLDDQTVDIEKTFKNYESLMNDITLEKYNKLKLYEHLSHSVENVTINHIKQKI